MNKAYEQVKQFHAACGIEMPDKPTLLSGAGIATNRITANHMELACDVMKSGQYGGGEVNNRGSYMLEELAEFMRASTIEDQADALIDLTYFIFGTFTLMGINPEPIFDIVQAANMAKVGPDGKVILKEQGKIQKPEGWHENFAPESKIREEIERQRGQLWGT